MWIALAVKFYLEWHMVEHFRLQRARLGGRVFSGEDLDAFVYLIKVASAGFHVARSL